MRQITHFLAFSLVANALFAQKPVINPGGVVNAASLAKTNGPSHGLVRGSIASIFGQNLAATTQTATSYPLPTMLAGTFVTVNGALAPLFYVSGGQINFQVPSSVNFGTYGFEGHASVIVATSGGTSDPVTVDVWVVAPGIFTQDGSGCGPGAIVNVKPDGTRSLNSPANGASPGDSIEVYGTGLYEFYNVPPDGMPAPANPLERSNYEGGGYFGLTQPQDSDGAIFTGGSPGLVGVDQVDLVVPATVRQGCNVPLQITNYPVLYSQAVTMSIHSGGGQCVDPPIASAGVLVLKRSIVLNDNTIPESDTITASFTASPGQTAAIYPSEDVFSNLAMPKVQGPACPVPGYSTLSPGALTLTSPGGAQVEVQPTPVQSSIGLDTGTPVYQATLPPGFLQAGTYQISGGGKDTGPFQVSIDMGSDIQITSQFPQGRLVGSNPFHVDWTGGQPGTVVLFRAIQHYDQYDEIYNHQAPGTAGTVGLQDGLVRGTAFGTEIDVLVGPDYSQGVPTIQVPGLTLGLQVLWIIEYRFIGLQ